MASPFGSSGEHYPDESFSAVARDASYAKGDCGFRLCDNSATGVTSTDATGKDSAADAVREIADYSIDARRHAVLCVAEQAITQNQRGFWRRRGLVRARVNFSGAATYIQGTALVVSAVDGTNQLQEDATLPAAGTANQKVYAHLAADVTTTGAGIVDDVWVHLEGISGFGS